MQYLTAGPTTAPEHVVAVGPELRADAACRLAAEGTGLLWRGDHRIARQLLAAMKRRLDRPARTLPPTAAYHRARRLAARRSRVLSMLLVELRAGYVLDQPHAPDVRAACTEVYGPPTGPAVISLQELLGVVGAHEWRRRGVWVAALGARIHPHYGVFAPTRAEHVELVARTPIPQVAVGFDIGTGTGVLAALLAGGGVGQVVATDIEPRAVECARANLERLGVGDRVRVEHTDLFPAGRAELVVCNPPWIPGTPVAPLDAGVYDPRGATLARFLRDLPAHLTAAGEAWLVLSDLPELLGLRRPDAVQSMIATAGLRVAGRSTTGTATTARRGDPLGELRARETIILWRLRRAEGGRGIESAVRCVPRNGVEAEDEADSRAWSDRR